MSDWKVYTYNSNFEQEVFASILNDVPGDEKNRKRLAEILKVIDEPTPDVYVIVDTWMRRTMDLTQLQRYLLMYPYLLEIEKWLSLHFRREYKLDISLLLIHKRFLELLGTYRWDSTSYHLHFWTLFFPVVNCLYLLSDFEAGMVYAKLPPTLPLVESSEELQLALRDLFLEEIGTLCFRDGLAYGRYINLQELSMWKIIEETIVVRNS